MSAGLKKRQFEIGKGVTGEIDTLVNTRLLVQANSGAGKSWCLRRLLEQTHGQIQHLVIDPEGEFASLREKFDYVLAAKTGGDTVADPRHAKLLAERLLELGVSAILDIYELAPSERVRFVRVFLESLVDAPKHLWHPVLVVLDEAHVYAPEQGEAESADAVKGLATRGRKRGFCLVAATQRLSKLHKDVAAECNNKLIGRSSLDVDMKRAAAELGFNTKEQLLSLRDMDNGEFFAFGPALTRTVTRVHVGDVQTTHPKAGSHLAAVVPPPTDKVRAVLAKLADLPQEAERKAATESELKQQIATLKRELTTARKEQPTPQPTIQRVEVTVFTDAERASLERLRESVVSLMDASATISDELKILVRAVQSRVASAPPPVQRQAPTPRPQQQPARRPSSGSGESMPPGERAVLTAAAMFDGGVSRDQLGVLTGYKRSTRDAYIVRLNAKGWLDTRGSGHVVATDLGIDALGDFEPLPTGDELLEWWRSRLPEGERAVLNVLVAAGGEPVARETIDTETGFKRSTRDAYLARLKARRLVDLLGRGQVRASGELFQ